MQSLLSESFARTLARTGFDTTSLMVAAERRCASQRPIRGRCAVVIPIGATRRVTRKDLSINPRFTTTSLRRTYP